jgi:hypothetical protein
MMVLKCTVFFCAAKIKQKDIESKKNKKKQQFSFKNKNFSFFYSLSAEAIFTLSVYFSFDGFLVFH